MIGPFHARTYSVVAVSGVTAPFAALRGVVAITAAAVAPDLDYASYFAGAAPFLDLHRSALHSFAGGLALCAGVSAIVLYASQKYPATNTPRHKRAPLTLKSAFALCALGFLSHMLLDLASGEGIQLLWPFKNDWSRWNLAESFDPWVLFLLVAGFLLPQLFRLVREEVGASKKRTGAGAAIFTLILIVFYFGGRAYLHSRAIETLLSAEYHQREPLSAGAFPSTANPLAWRGVVATDNTIEEIEVNLGPGVDFNPDRGLTHYKPGGSPQLNVAEESRAAQRFLRYAAFPFATAARREDGYRVELRDMRFPAGDTSAANIIVRVEMTSSLQISKEVLRFASSSSD